MTPFESLFAPAALRDAVSGRAWLAAMLEVERALAKAGASAGIVPASSAEAIAEACGADDFDWEQLLEQGRASGNPAEPLVRSIVARVGEENARFVHLGATSQDVMDTAAMLVTRRALGLVSDDLARVTAALRGAGARAPRHADGGADAPAAGRSDDLRAQGGRLARRGDGRRGPAVGAP